MGSYRNAFLLLASSIGTGLLLTLATRYFPAIGRMGVDVAQWGSPIAYVSQRIPSAKLYFNWGNFAIDFAFWSLLSSMIMSFVHELSMAEKRVAAARAEGQQDAAEK